MVLSCVEQYKELRQGGIEISFTGRTALMLYCPVRYSIPARMLESTSPPHIPHRIPGNLSGLYIRVFLIVPFIENLRVCRCKIVIAFHNLPISAYRALCSLDSCLHNRFPFVPADMAPPPNILSRLLIDHIRC